MALKLEAGGELPLIQYWDSEEVPASIADSLGSFAELNADMPHLVFSRADAEELIAEHFSAREVAAFRACAVPAMQADYFRVCATLALGGVYSDADFRCIAPLRPLVPAPGRVRVFQGPGRSIINGIFAGGSPGHRFLALALEIATANIERRDPDNVYFATGPPIFTALVVLHRCGSRDGSIYPIKNRPLQDAVWLYWQTIESAERLSAALSGVEIGQPDDYMSTVEAHPHPYKQSATHWTQFNDSIFAEGANESGA